MATPEPRPPRIAIVRGAWNAAGGAERFVQRIATALAARGVELTLVARRWPQAGQDGLPGSVRVLEVDAFHIGRAWRDAAFARDVQRVVREQGFDLVQSHERIPGLDMYRAGDGVHRQWLALRRRQRGALRGMTDALSASHRTILRKERAMFTHPALRCVICNSEMVRDEIVRHYGVEPGKLAVIRNGLDLQRFRPPTPAEHQAARAALGLPADKTVFLFVGSGFDRKGVAVALRALARGDLRDKALLVIVGHDKHLARYQALAQSLGIAGAVRFDGARGDVVPSYHAADAFVLPTLYDPQSNAMLEAMGCGLPVITSTTSGAAELLSADSGHVVDALDDAAVAAAMTDLLDRQRCRRLGAAARAAIEPYTLERMTDDYLALYARLMPTPDQRP
ncbi:MAG: glycosyltransferase family 1 protein [Comamonadaceae bacterium]|nr:MAG: glycosyltransferase family 1 protein [Comamonadaceae bacterium]